METHLKCFNAAALYLEEKFVDLEAGHIIRLTPVNAERARDEARQVRYFSNILCNANGQHITIGFEIDAQSLAQAIEMWPACAEEAAKSYEQQALDQRVRQQLVVPSSARIPS